MCGICGQISLAREFNPSRETVLAMMSKMVHRGPDSSGIFLSDRVAIGMRRLSLVDLSGGDQPIFNEDRTLAIVMNGEIYNFRELREQIDDRHTFSTMSDTEVVLHLFEEHGVGVFDLIEGMYAIVIVHIPTGNTWIARDPFGIKPLYWNSSDDRLVFASELESLSVDRSVSRSISKYALGEFFTFGYVRGSQAIFEGVYHLRPGHYLQVLDNRVEEIPFYSFADLLQSPCDISESEAFDELENLLSYIIPSYQAADVPVAAFLSGGIDSSLVCKYMEGDKPSTYSMAFNSSSFHDESPYAAKVADILGTHHRSVIMDYPDIETILKIISHFGEPFADSSAIPTFLVSREIAKDVKAALSGDGADEVFMGYTIFQGSTVANCLRYLPFKGLISAALKGASGIGSNRSESIDTFVRRLDHASKPLITQLLNKQSMFSPELSYQASCLSTCSREALEREDFFREHLEILNSDFTSLNRRIALMLLTLKLPGGILTKVDRAAMATSLEVRIPFLDRRFVRFAFSLPDKLKLNGLQTKYLMRKLASKYYPASISKRPKHGFTVPLLDWFTGNLGDYLETQMKDSAAADEGLIDPEGVIGVIHAHRAGSINASSTLYSMFVLEQWARKWL